MSLSAGATLRPTLDHMILMTSSNAIKMPFKFGSNINNSPRKDGESLKMVQNKYFRVEDRKVWTVLKHFKNFPLFVMSLAIKCCQMGQKFQFLNKSSHKHRNLHRCKHLYA